MEESGEETDEQTGLCEMKQDKPLVSVIVPAYQAADVLPRCLQSLSDQTYQDLEILVIDDGSRDKTQDVMEAARKRDPRIRVFFQPHRGVSAARNRGIEESKGEFLVFCDADDDVEKTYVEKMIDHSECNDLVICGYDRVREGKEKWVYRESGSIPRVELYERALCGNEIGGSCWNKLFRKKIIADNTLRFREDISIGEDMLFCVSYYRFCRAIYYVGEGLYHYCFRADSLMKAVSSGKQFDICLFSCLDAADALASVTWTDEETGTVGQERKNRKKRREEKRPSDGKKLREEKQQREEGAVGDGRKEEREKIAACISYRRIRSAVWLMYQMAAGKCADRAVFDRMKRMVRQSLPGCRRENYSTWLERFTAYGIAVCPGLVYRASVTANLAVGAWLKRYLR